MKKIFFTGLLMLFTALAVNAQNLVGKQWCTVLNDEDGQGIAVALTFEKNGTCEMLIAAQQDMKEEGVPINLIASVTVPGTYKLDGKDLNNQFNNGKAKVDVDYEIKGMDAKTKAMMAKEIKGRSIRSRQSSGRSCWVECPRWTTSRSSSSRASSSWSRTATIRRFLFTPNSAYL